MTRHMIPSLMLAAVSALPAATSAAAPIGTTTVLVQTGDAPAAGPGAFTAFTSLPALNDAGQVAFLADLGGAGIDSTNHRGLYRFGDAGAVQIARTGDAPAAGPGNFIRFGSPALNEAGQAAFGALLGGAGVDSTNNLGLYRFGDAGAVQIARTGDAPPAGLGNVTGVGGPALNDTGQLVFRATLGGAGVDLTNNLGLYRFGDAGAVQIARTGDAPPAGPGAFKGFNIPNLNDAGQVVFFANLGGAGVDSTNNLGLYRFGDAGAVQIARTGDAPPAGPGAFTNLFSPPFNPGIALNDAGQVAFVAGLGGAGVDSTNNRGLYRFGDASAVEIARTGDAPPAGPGYFTYFNNPALNDAGQVAFLADLGGAGVDLTNERGLYRFGDAGAVQIARTGDAAPAGPGAFTGFGFDIFDITPALNDAGQVAFFADLGGAGVDPTNDSGIYLYDDMLGLIPVARLGDPFLGSTITSLGFNSGLADETSGFNNLGQVAYSFALANGNSGIALFTIPEPTTVALLALGGLTLLLRRSARVV